MVTLADINSQLQNQNNVLKSVDKSIGSVSTSLEAFLKGLANRDELERMRALEDQRERQRQSQSAPPSSGSTDKNDESKKGGMLSGLIPAGLSLGAAAGVGKAITGSLLNKKNILRAGAILYADEIAKLITDAFDIQDPEIQGAISRGITGAALGSIFGPKFALIGGVLATQITEETPKLTQELGAEIGETVKILTEKWNEDITPVLEDLEKDLKTYLDVDIDLVGGIERAFKYIKEINFSLDGAIKQLTDSLAAANKYLKGEELTESDTQELIDGGLLVGGAAATVYGIKKFRNRGKGTPKDKSPQSEMDDDGPDQKPKPQPKPTTPPVGTEIKQNGKTYRWQGAAWGEVGKNGKVGLSATKEVGEELTKKALSKGALRTGLAVAGKGIARFIPGLGWALLAADVAEMMGVPVYDTIGDLTSSAWDFVTGEDGQPGMQPTGPMTASVLTKEANIMVENAKLGGAPVVFDNSSRVVGGSTSVGMQIAPGSTHDKMDDTTRDAAA